MLLWQIRPYSSSSICLPMGADIRWTRVNCRPNGRILSNRNSTHRHLCRHRFQHQVIICSANLVWAVPSVMRTMTWQRVCNKFKYHKANIAARPRRRAWKVQVRRRVRLRTLPPVRMPRVMLGPDPHLLCRSGPMQSGCPCKFCLLFPFQFPVFARFVFVLSLSCSCLSLVDFPVYPSLNFVKR